MHADFRDQLMTAETSYQIEALLKQELELN